MVPICSAASASSNEERDAVPSSSIAAVSCASPPIPGACRPAPPPSAKVAATIGRSRLGITHSGRPHRKARTSGRGARNRDAGALEGWTARSSGTGGGPARRPWTVNATRGRPATYRAAMSRTASGVTP